MAPRKYAAIVLDDASRRRLLAWWKSETGVPLLPKVFADHMTLKAPGDTRVTRHGDRALRVVGWAADDKGQAVVVSMSTLTDFDMDGRIPHVTIATAADGRQRYSNELLRGGYKKVADGPRLYGEIRILDSSLPK